MQGKVYYWHTWGVSYDTLDKEEYKHLYDEFLVMGHSKTGINHDEIKFVAVVEHRKYPIYGVQFHPEKA